MEPQTTGHNLQVKIKSYLETLALETDLARKSETMQRYLEFVAKFHKYSPTNIMLILLARPDASYVMGFNSWKKLNRFVNRGERGIAILAPLIHKEDLDDDKSPKILSGFRIVYVFDVTQTDGEPLPPIPDWKSPEKNLELTEKLLKFAEKKGINVTFKNLPGEIQGISKGKSIEIDLCAGSKTLIHEIAHEMLHHCRERPVDHSTRELEAEATAFVVATYFGISGLRCPNYLALFDVSSKNLLSNMKNILDTATLIINSVESIQESDSFLKSIVQ